MRRLAREAQASVSLLGAASLVVVTAAAALAVDLGALYQEGRRLQGVADAAALAAAGNLPAAGSAAQAAVDANPPVRAGAPTVTTGLWTADPNLAPAARFVPGGSGPNAAKVTLAERAPLFFGRLFGVAAVPIARSATAARIDLAAFSIGSRLAAVNGGIANQLLGALTGSSVSLTAADYQALAGADIDLFAFADALRGELHLTGGSFNQALAASTTLPHVVAALAAAAGAGGNPAAQDALARLAAQVGPVAVSTASLVDLGPAGAQDRLAGGPPVAVNAYALVQAALQIAGGTRQVSLDLDGAVPGLAHSTATLAIGDRMASSPWVTVTARGQPVVRTSQLRLFLDTGIGGSPALKALGIDGVRLPLYLELAQAQARLSSLSCTSGARGVTLAVQPSLGHAAIADVKVAGLLPMSTVPAEQPATLASIAGLRATGAASLPLSGGGWQTVSFTSADIAAHAVRTINSGGTAGALAAGLESAMAIDVSVGPLSIPSPATAALVRPVLDAAAPLVDQLLGGLLGLLGVHLGQADVRVDGLRCGASRLVA